MKRTFSTREAAKRLGVHILTLQRHMRKKNIQGPRLQKVGGVTVRFWSGSDIEKARKVLAKMKPGRKPKQK